MPTAAAVSTAAALPAAAVSTTAAMAAAVVSTSATSATAAVVRRRCSISRPRLGLSTVRWRRRPRRSVVCRGVMMSGSRRMSLVVRRRARRRGKMARAGCRSTADGIGRAARMVHKRGGVRSVRGVGRRGEMAWAGCRSAADRVGRAARTVHKRCGPRPVANARACTSGRIGYARGDGSRSAPESRGGARTRG